MVRNQSDHAPLLISTAGFNKHSAGSKLFRFQLAWTLHPEFDNWISQAWKANCPLPLALGDLAERLTVWNKETFGNLFRKKDLYGVG